MLTCMPVKLDDNNRLVVPPPKPNCDNIRCSDCLATPTVTPGTVVNALIQQRDKP